jgi:hypothetical protein
MKKDLDKMVKYEAQLARNPPVIRAELHVNQVLRYIALGTIQVKGITVTDLLSLYLMNIGSGTSYYSMTQSVKIKKISLYSAQRPAGQTYEDLDLIWGGTTDTKVVKSTVTLSESVGYIGEKPPKDSYANFWISNSLTGSTNIFKVSLPVGAVMDIHVDMVLAGDSAFTANTVTGYATGVAQTIYLGYLDGAGGDIAPIAGLTSTN